MPRDKVDHAFQYAPGEEAPLPERIGRFQVAGRAGGSQATIFKARDPDTGAEVAIKAISNRYDSFAHSLLIALLGEVDMEEIRREAELLAGLKHPNIVSVIEVGEDANLGPYLVMEWVPGGNLRARLDPAEGGRLPVKEALRIAVEVLDGLAAAHEAGIVHRDVKPENILLAEDGTVKLADFGIAGDAALAGRGTPGYMAPEQHENQETDSVGPAADIYATGVVLFEMLTGRLPDTGEDVQTSLAEAGQGIAAVVARATDVDPANALLSRGYGGCLVRI